MNRHPVGYGGLGTDDDRGAGVAVDNDSVLDIDLFLDENRRDLSIRPRWSARITLNGPTKTSLAISTWPMIWADGSIRALGSILGISPARLGRMLFGKDVIISPPYLYVVVVLSAV